ncbi:hypothetical protein [Streptomyces sp. C10]|uniref:hypothetical protein n=1 Tax=Streptomyces sp. C10 TaxID=531941 RepID=UPI0039810808
MIRDLIFAESARAQFDVLTKRHKADVGEALLRIVQETDHRGVWRAGDNRRLAVTYDVHPSAIVVTGISTAQAGPAGSRQPYQGMEMRKDSRGRWIHLNPHEE